MRFKILQFLNSSHYKKALISSHRCNMNKKLNQFKFGDAQPCDSKCMDVFLFIYDVIQTLKITFSSSGVNVLNSYVITLRSCDSGDQSINGMFLSLNKLILSHCSFSFKPNFYFLKSTIYQSV